MSVAAGFYFMNDQNLLDIHVDSDTPIPEEGIIQHRDALSVDLDGVTFIKIANKWKEDSIAFYNTIRLYERRKANETQLFARLSSEKKKKYQSDYLDNVIYEGESYLKPIAMSRMPDLVVKQGNEGQESKKIAEDVTRVVDTDIKHRNRRKVLAMAFKHHPVYFTGIIKAVWNPEKGKNGDYEFKVVHPDNCIPDHTATTNDARDMRYIFEAIELDVKEWVMRFPDKEEEFYEELHKRGVFSYEEGKANEKNDAGMSSKIKGWELWFTQYEKSDGGYKKVECVAWYYEELLFKALKSPNWDWEGEEKSLNAMGEMAQEGDLRNMMAGMIADPSQVEMLESDQIFRNHLEYPDKPYFFMGYDQWGKMPFDETSRIEQALPLQKDANKRGKQVTEMLDRARGKHVFSGEGGLQKKDVEAMDLNNPDEDIFIKGDVGKVHAFIPGEQPSAQMIQDKEMLRDRVFSKLGVNGGVRGEVESDVATTNQIAREGDFTRADDVTEDTINAAAEWMANWGMQFMKLRYTETHFKRILGEDGATIHARIDRDMIEDGMEVVIGASGTDKIKAEQRAMDMAKMGMTDPFTFYKDMNMSDPKGRTERLVLYNMDLNMYYAKVVMGQDNVMQMAGALNGAETAQQAMMAIASIQAGQVPAVPAAIDQSYLDTINQWAGSGEIEALAAQNPQLKEQILGWLQQIVALGEMIGQQPTMNNVSPGMGQPMQQPAPGNPMSGGSTPVGNVSRGASPTNTNRIAVNPPRPGVM